MNNVSSSSSSSGGIGFVGLLTIVFIVLKLTGYIAWSWWWVLSPLWIAFLFWVVIISVIGGIAVYASLKDDERKRNKFKNGS